MVIGVTSWSVMVFLCLSWFFIIIHDHLCPILFLGGPRWCLIILHEVSWSIAVGCLWWFLMIFVLDLLGLLSWSSMVLHSSWWTLNVLHDPSWSFMSHHDVCDPFSQSWTFDVICGLLWSYVILHDFLWSILALCGPSWTFMDLHGS